MKKYGLTLIELLITVLLVGLVVLSFISIQRFAFHNIIASDRRAKLQNEGYLILERMTKDLSRAIGEAWNTDCASHPFYLYNVTAQIVFKVMLENNTSATPANYTDNTIAIYHYNRTAYTVRYCPQRLTSQLYCNAAHDCFSTDAWDLLSNKVANLSITPSISNASAMINITMRHDPVNQAGIDNPEVNLTTTVRVGSSSVQ